MKKALIINVIDPMVGGVLLTGHQGTGKSTAVRSLAEILPDIETVADCPFSCDPDADPDYLCDACKKKILYQKEKVDTIIKPIKLVNLPLGVTEDMVCGSLDLERVLKEGIKSLHPGLLAKANRGLLYIDEINLLQDHIVDILLDSAASGVNIIEREGVSISHPARFVLVGSMNPEEGELRPQINDRLGLEVVIDAPSDPKVRATITERVMSFSDNPKAFIQKYEPKQEQLKEKIIRAKEILTDVTIPKSIYVFVSNLVTELGIESQRADITFIRCARANAAFRGSTNVSMQDLDAAIDLVFEHRLRAVRDDIEPEEIKDKIQDIYGKIKESYEDPEIYKPNREQEGPMKHSDEPQDEFKRQPYDPEKLDEIPETKDQKLPDNEDENFERNQSDGMKVSDNYTGNRFSVEDLKTVSQHFSKRITNIIKLLRNNRQISDFSGRGNRTKITSSQKGRYISYRYPTRKPKSIAFDASIKRCLVRQICEDKGPLTTMDRYPKPVHKYRGEGSSSASWDLSGGPIAGSGACAVSLPINMERSDIMEKIFEFRAPVSMYFILDASGSMNRYIGQMAEVIRALHTEGYKKKDKASVLVFRGKKAHVLQRPTTNMSRIMGKLPSIEGTSYTPLASALTKVENMIKAEKMKNKDIIPIVIICSDLGANISLKHPELKAQTQEDWAIIINELKTIAKRFGQKKIRMICMIPKKGYAIRFLGVDAFSVERIKKAFKRHADAKIFEFDGYNPKETIIKLRKIL